MIDTCGILNEKLITSVFYSPYLCNKKCIQRLKLDFYEYKQFDVQSNVNERTASQN